MGNEGINKPNIFFLAVFVNRVSGTCKRLHGGNFSSCANSIKYRIISHRPTQMHTDMLIIPPAYGILSVCVCVGRASVASGWPIILLQGDAIIPTAQVEIFTVYREIT